MCKRPSGCPVGKELKDPQNRYYDPDPLIQIGRALAADVEVNEFVQEFTKAKALYEYNGIVGLQEQKFKEMGLLDDTEFLLRLEQIYREARNKANSESVSQPTKGRPAKTNQRGR